MLLSYGDVDLDKPERGRQDARLGALGGYAGGAAVQSLHNGGCVLATAGRGVSGRSLSRPASFGDGRYLSALDGWLTDRAALGEALGSDGVAAMRDDELVAAALMRWGDDGLLRLHGQFAIAWWDAAARRLLLACDRTGGRTLFYHPSSNGRRLRFSGAVGVLLADPDIPRQVNPAAVARSGFPFGFDPHNTCFVGVEQIVAGEKLVFSESGVKIERYGRLDPHRRIYFRRDEDYVDAARELLDRVVADHSPSAGPTVAMLSGGLDSAAVAATAARLSLPGRIFTLTARPDLSVAEHAPGDHWFTDEWDLAQDVARLHPNIIAEATPARLDSIEDLVRRHSPWVGRPPPNLLPAMWFEQLWLRARALGAQALLGGRSGNATLSATALVTALRPAGVADLPGALADGLMRFRRRPGRRSAVAALRGLVPPWAGPWLRRVTGRPPSWLNRTAMSEKARIEADFAGLWRDVVAGAAEAPFRRRWRFMCIESTWRGSSIRSPLRFPRGLEYRDPLGDVRLAEFCLALPPDQFTRGREDRFLARRVLADRLPPSVLNEKRTGRQNPEWFGWMTRLRPWLAAELDSLDNSSLGRELVDVPRLRAGLDDWPADAAAAEARAFEFLEALGGGACFSVFLRWAEGRNN